MNDQEQPFARRVVADGDEDVDGGGEGVANAAVSVITKATLHLPWLYGSAAAQSDGDDEPDSGPGVAVCLSLRFRVGT